jgi:hypothetical protein
MSRPQIRAVVCLAATPSRLRTNILDIIHIDLFKYICYDSRYRKAYRLGPNLYVIIYKHER